jgi:hypothetical protein
MTRKEALLTNSKRYHGAPCKGCGNNERWTSAKSCITCATGRQSQSTWHNSPNGKASIARSKFRMRHSVEGRSSILIYSATRRALQEGYEFGLTVEWVASKLQKGTCEATGIPFDLSPSNETIRNKYAPSLDRIDNTKGYTEDNVRLVVWMYNVAKNEYSHEDLLAFAKQLIAFSGVKENYGK